MPRCIFDNTYYDVVIEASEHTHAPVRRIRKKASSDSDHSDQEVKPITGMWADTGGWLAKYNLADLRL